MTLFEELTWRGFVNQITHDELARLIDMERFTVYCGFDPSADSLHIGQILPILLLRHFQRHGHKVIALVGGATGMIGDPGGKTEERQLLSREQVEANAAGLRGQLGRFLDFDGPNPATMLNNADWLAPLPLIDFLRDIGKHFSVNVMMARESVRRRLEDREHGISFTEFSYSLLQSYDFLHLHDTCDCRLQVGGSDQWGNIVAGMDLTRRLRGTETFGLTFPLLTKSDGTKFGKSEAGAVWLDPARTSPYKMFQFFINQADADVPRLLRLLTNLPKDEIEALEARCEEAPEARDGQRRLAEEVTGLIHGEEALQNAIRAAKAMFGGELRGLDDATLEDVFSEVPSTQLPRSALAEQRPLIDVLVDAGVFDSKGQARRMLRSGGLYLNNERVTAEDAVLGEASLCSATMAVVRKGKKDYHLLRFAE
ncbi:MAG: tyrosine--tRNA ligase [Candidatus Hydrogenedentes bacterium]|nr:tyrosine--tRNA ligase [Candidatus Hydrogenedentota bacterium]